MPSFNQFLSELNYSLKDLRLINKCIFLVMESGGKIWLIDRVLKTGLLMKYSR